MARRTLSAALALVPAAALLLTACGSTAPKPSHVIAGAGGGSTAASAGAAGKAGSSGATPAGAPAITLPADVHVDIQPPAPAADRATDAAVADLEYAIRALRAGFAQDDGQVKPMLHAYAVNAGLFWAKRIDTAKRQGRTITGTYRYYDLAVHLKGKNLASAGFCEDQRQAFSKEIRTGKVLRTTPGKDDFYAFTAQLSRNAAGTWQISAESWIQGDPSCVRD